MEPDYFAWAAEHFDADTNIGKLARDPEQDKLTESWLKLVYQGWHACEAATAQAQSPDDKTWDLNAMLKATEGKPELLGDVVARRAKEWVERAAKTVQDERYAAQLEVTLLQPGWDEDDRLTLQASFKETLHLDPDEDYPVYPKAGMEGPRR